MSLGWIYTTPTFCPDMTESRCQGCEERECEQCGEKLVINADWECFPFLDELPFCWACENPVPEGWEAQFLHPEKEVLNWRFLGIGEAVALYGGHGGSLWHVPWLWEQAHLEAESDNRDGEEGEWDA